jgi:hypothetical protein
MRFALVAAVVSMVSPTLAAAQDLGPRTLLPMHVACSDLPVTTPSGATLTVAGSQRADGRLSLGTGDIAVIRAGTPQGLAVGQSYFARRLPWGRQAFERGEAGFAAVRTAGVLTVIAVDERFALARVDRACDTVIVGDYLEPAHLPALPAAAAAGAPNFDDRASILFGKDLRLIAGDGDVVAINRGTMHGVVPGVRFALYRDPRNGLPLSELGEAVVIEAGELSSRAVLVRVADVVTSGDVAVRRASGQP